MKVFFLLFLSFQSILFSEESRPEVKLLIVGCGRSGTTYTTELLNAAGLHLLHEQPGGLNGAVAWPMVFNYYSHTGAMQEHVEFDHVFHQVRNPLDVITSWYINLNDLDNDVWSFVRTQVPQISKYDSHLTQCAKYWYYWNLQAEALSEWRYRIEDIDEVFTEFEEKLGVILEKQALQKIPRNFNTWRQVGHKLTWSDLERWLPKQLFQNIQEMAERYGYETCDLDKNNFIYFYKKRG